MGMTLAEKILSEHSDKEVRAGEIAVVKVDLSYAQDGTGPLAVRKIEEMGFEKVYRPQRTIFFLDHAAPSPMEKSVMFKWIRSTSGPLAMAGWKTFKLQPGYSKAKRFILKLV